MASGSKRCAATGTSSVKSPAQRITTASYSRSARGMSSARPATTRQRRSPSSRTTVDRNDARRSRDLIRVTFNSGRTILSGMPGTPAPDPRSAMTSTSVGSRAKNRRLSRMTFSISHRGSIDPTRRWTRCHRVRRVRYRTNASVSRDDRSRSRIRLDSSARTVSSERLSRTGGRVALLVSAARFASGDCLSSTRRGPWGDP